MKLIFDEKTNQYTVVEPEIASMEAAAGGIAGTLDKVASMEILGVPLGGVALGSAFAILMDRVILTRVDPEHKWGSYALLGSALLIARFGKKFLGKTADFTAIILTYEAIADWITSAVDRIVPPPAATLPQSYGGSQAQGSQAQGSMRVGELGIYAGTF